MLVQLHIKDLAIIDEVSICPGPGLNVLTGETGAGKSIIVGAAGLLRGGRGSAELVRAGSKEAVVEALFELQDSPQAASGLDRAGLASDDAELLVRRVVSAAGRSRVNVNGSLCTVALLRELAGQLIDIAGQHEYQLLSNRQVHRQILDAVGVKPADLQAMAAAHARLQEVAQALQQTRASEMQRTERIDFLRFQLQELEQAELSPAEDQTLDQERQRLQRASELMEAAASGEQELYSRDRSVMDRLAVIRRQLGALAPVDPRLDPLAAQLDEAGALVEDVALSLRQYRAGIDLDPARLDQVEQRLDQLHRLARKHGGSLDAALERQQQMQRELADLDSLEQRMDQLEAELGAARTEAEAVATRLSKLRGAAADRLGREVSRHLADLRMKGARLVVELAPRPRREGDPPALSFGGRSLSPSGWDRVEFRISANPGEQARALGRVASGGELSRVMLALRRVLGKHDPVATSIYDEVDAGIGGAVAAVVGRYLAAVAQHRQVLCVTHLPQVAAYADRHFLVGKSSGDGRTSTTVHQLDHKQRVEELARMLGGEKVTPKARANAGDLLEQARKNKE